MLIYSFFTVYISLMFSFCFVTLISNFWNYVIKAEPIVLKQRSRENWFRLNAVTHQQKLSNDQLYSYMLSQLSATPLQEPLVIISIAADIKQREYHSLQTTMNSFSRCSFIKVAPNLLPALTYKSFYRHKASLVTQHNKPPELASAEPVC